MVIVKLLLVVALVYFLKDSTLLIVGAIILGIAYFIWGNAKGSSSRYNGGRRNYNRRRNYKKRKRW